MYNCYRLSIAIGYPLCITAIGYLLCITAIGYLLCITAIGYLLCITAIGYPLCITAIGYPLCITAIGYRYSRDGHPSTFLEEGSQLCLPVLLPGELVAGSDKVRGT